MARTPPFNLHDFLGRESERMGVPDYEGPGSKGPPPKPPDGRKPVPTPKPKVSQKLKAMASKPPEKPEPREPQTPAEWEQANTPPDMLDPPKSPPKKLSVRMPRGYGDRNPPDTGPKDPEPSPGTGRLPLPPPKPRGLPGGGLGGPPPPGFGGPRRLPKLTGLSTYRNQVL